MKKRVLITGGFGYLGGRIAVEIARTNNWIVRLASRKVRPEPYWLEGVETVDLDVMNPESISVAAKGCQAVVHLAAMNENQCVESPETAVNINTLGCLNMLQVAISQGVGRFIYFSTAHVYGAPLEGYIDEEKLPRPIHPYAITHHAAEDFILAYHDQEKITGLVVRLSNGFGAPTHPDVDRWTLLVNDLCRQAVDNRKLILRSSGVQQRDFITLTDVGRAAVHLLDLPKGKCDDGLFNVGGESSLSIWQMTQRIAERCQVVFGYTPEVIRPEPGEDEASEKVIYDIEKLKRSGFTLAGDVDDEIDAMLVFCGDSFGEK